MKKLFMHACTALSNVGISGLHFGLFTTLLRNRLNANDGVVVNSTALPAYISSTQLYRISTMNRYPQKAGVLFL